MGAQQSEDPSVQTCARINKRGKLELSIGLVTDKESMEADEDNSSSSRGKLNLVNEVTGFQIDCQ